MEQIKYIIALSQIKGIGIINAKKIISLLGNAKEFFTKEGKEKIKQNAKNFFVEDKELLRAIKTADKEIDFINKNNIKCITYLDNDYPNRLKYCDDSPLYLFYRGNINLNNEKIISIVGTRNATKYGKDICKDFISELSQKHPDTVIVSGLAVGIDVTAHSLAIDNNLKTIAVLGHSHKTIYPQSNIKVAKNILKNGALLTEFTTNSIFDRKNFVRRNRIVAGISDATIIIESAEKGGALITAEMANSYNRDVFAFPGNIYSKYSKGCNKLIKENKAALIENIDDLEKAMNWIATKTKNIQSKIFVELNNEQKIIVDILKNKGNLQIDILSMETKMPMSKISALLLEMEFNGIIECLPGKIYSLSKYYNY